ncbi:PREDICTED: uncharacterized protein LOC109483030 [Branchiostoma belcheri]|uniref:Uncharacterized protein LOC109483030 n=1 Tax=Branchiostoma belcheri TaxID=7741 RepID=A0A6P5A5I7_BRABE|nr:PREDICTED: uncharacterized protein LOC109483030 [Branchiostoma belcheri]
MAASPCLLLFAAIFPTVLGQELHIDVAIGETAKFPLRSFTNFDDRKMLGLALVNDTVTIELVTLAAGAPVQNAIIHAKWQGRLSLLEGPDGTVAELSNVQPSDTGREVYYQYQQTHGPEGQGAKMYVNIKIPPPAVSSFSITNAGEDYVNITLEQVKPYDSAPVGYRLEYREAATSQI